MRGRVCVWHCAPTHLTLLPCVLRQQRRPAGQQGRLETPAQHRVVRSRDRAEFAVQGTRHREAVSPAVSAGQRVCRYSCGEGVWFAAQGIRLNSAADTNGCALLLCQDWLSRKAHPHVAGGGLTESQVDSFVQMCDTNQGPCRTSCVPGEAEAVKLTAVLCDVDGYVDLPDLKRALFALNTSAQTAGPLTARRAGKRESHRGRKVKVATDAPSGQAQAVAALPRYTPINVGSAASVLASTSSDEDAVGEGPATGGEDDLDAIITVEDITNNRSADRSVTASVLGFDDTDDKATLLELTTGAWSAMSPHGHTRNLTRRSCQRTAVVDELASPQLPSPMWQPLLSSRS